MRHPRYSVHLASTAGCDGIVQRKTTCTSASAKRPVDVPAGSASSTTYSTSCRLPRTARKGCRWNWRSCRQAQPPIHIEQRYNRNSQAPPACCSQAVTHIATSSTVSSNTSQLPHADESDAESDHLNMLSTFTQPTLQCTCARAHIQQHRAQRGGVGQRERIGHARAQHQRPKAAQRGGRLLRHAHQVVLRSPADAGCLLICSCMSAFLPDST